MKEIRIYTSRIKNFGLFVVSLALAASGVMMLIFGGPGKKYPEWIFQAAGVFCIAFFGIGAVMALSRIISKQIGLTVNREGIRLGKSSFIAWREITGFSQVSIKGSKIIFIEVHNPQQFIDNEEGFFRRKMQQMNTSHYGTPFSISTAGLDISLKNLLAILQDYKQKADLQDMAHETHTFPSFQRDCRLN